MRLILKNAIFFIDFSKPIKVIFLFYVARASLLCLIQLDIIKWEMWTCNKYPVSITKDHLILSSPYNFTRSKNVICQVALHS